MKYRSRRTSLFLKSTDTPKLSYNVCFQMNTWPISKADKKSEMVESHANLWTSLKFIKAWIPRKQILKGLETCSIKSSSPYLFPIMIMSWLSALFLCYMCLPTSPNFQVFLFCFICKKKRKKNLNFISYVQGSSLVW